MRSNDIHPAVARLQKEITRWKTPIVTIIAGDKSPFKVLISCLLSLRTKDEVTAVATARLFALASTPEAMMKLTPDVVEKVIYPVGFYKNKAKGILEVCRILVEHYGSRVPDEIDELLKLKGVGRKTANLVVTLGYSKPGICVDTHVHRISNRWGYVKTKTPEETEMALRKKLPREYWLIINDLLVTFGQNHCKPISPLCSSCVISEYCDRAGVGVSR
ncbi:MAG: endonuclease III [Nitrospirota bacterium]|nr:endonuclease III [Nitrospirota bacterium]